MPVSSDLIGSTFPAAGSYTVTAERVGAFAAAIGSPPTTSSVPVTFPVVVSFAAMESLLADPDVGISLHRVVHGEQRFAYTRPLRVGDVLSATLTVDSLRTVAGADIISTRTDIVDETGALVVTAYATIVHRGEDA